MQFYKFNPIFKPVLWGGGKLLEFKHLPARDVPIGESWELSALQGRQSVVADGRDAGLTLSQLVQRYGADLVGEEVYRHYGDEFPLLIKLIDAKRDLSVQVHPRDELAMRDHGVMGKTEMWYVLQADDGAIIRTGFNRALTPEEYDRRLAEGSLLDVVNAIPSRQGDVFFIPAGQIHAIGAGNLVAEIQQSCDITYRVWDYGRKDAQGNLRQLHTAQAREALSFEPYNGYIPCKRETAMGITPVVACPKFAVDKVAVDGNIDVALQQYRSFTAIVCLQGQVTLAAPDLLPATLCQGQTALIPATVAAVAMSGSAQMLMTHVPQRDDSNRSEN